MIADIPVGGEQMGMLWTMYYDLVDWSFNNVDQTSARGAGLGQAACRRCWSGDARRCLAAFMMIAATQASVSNCVVKPCVAQTLHETIGQMATHA
jgi:hypothetical protein